MANSSYIWGEVKICVFLYLTKITDMETRKLCITGVLLFFLFVLIPRIADCQTVGIDSLTFDDGADPPNNLTEGAGNLDWIVDNTSFPSSNGYSTASGNYYLWAADGGDFGTTESITYTVSSLAYANLQVQWGAYKDNAAFPALTLAYSTDGSTFTTVGGWTDVTGNSTWALVGPVALPAGVANQPVVYVRWSWTDDGNAYDYLFDDIKISGTVNTYFSKAAGNLDVLGTWGTSFDGSGTSPANFTTAGITYEIVNNASATIGANWTVSGAGSKVRVGDAFTTPTINFTIPAAFSLTGSVDVEPNSTLTIQNTTIPTFGTLYTNSTVNYAASGAQGVTGITYSNLTISGSGTKTISAANTTVNGALTISAGDLVFPASPRTLTLNGSISGAGTLTGNSASSQLIIGGSGAFGTINFTTGSNSIKTFKVTRPSSTYTITLGTNLTVATTFFDTSGVLDLNGKTLTINGTATLPGAANTGKIKGSSTSNLLFASTISSGSLKMDQTSSSTKSLSSLLLNKLATTLTIGNALNIVDSIVPRLGTIASGGNVTLLADQTTVGHAGRIGVVGGSLTGNITSQVYHAPNTNNTDWRNLGVAGISNATFSAWNSQFPMTCPTCPSTSVGGQAFSSITTYQESNETYPDITYSGTITPGVGFWVYLGSSSPGTASSPYLISVTGTAQTGNVTAALTASDPGSMNGYNLVANPYASPISFTKLQANNAIDNSWYTYSPAYGDNAAYVGGISTPAYSHGGTGIDATIPAGMGFFVHTNAATTLTFIESLKTSGSNEVLLRENNSTQSQLTYFRMQVSNNTMMNEAVVRFDPNATTGFDPNYDLPDLPPGTPGWLQISSSSLGKPYTVNGLPDLTQNYSIPVTITSATTGQYQFTAADLQNMPSGACISLHDNYTGTDHDLRNGAFNLTITDTETVARFKLNVTVMPLAITTNAVSETCSNKTDGYITAVGTNAGPWNYTWKDANNNIVKSSLNKATADTLSGLQGGVYSVDVNTVGTCDIATQTFTLTAPPAPSAAFTPSATQTMIGNNVTFTNNSANASNYWWTFGDGSTSNLQSPVYAYNMPGIYTVTLLAINASCGDTVSSQQVITVNATTGIAAALAANDIVLAKDQAGVYVQFNFTNQTKVSINVYNAIGQALLSDARLAVVNDKIYLNLNNAKDQMIFVSISNLDKNTQVIKKLYND
jgi:PKD repeat protein